MEFFYSLNILLYSRNNIKTINIGPVLAITSDRDDE